MEGLTYIDKFLERSVGAFFLLKLVFPKQLMSTIRHEWLEMRSSLYEEVTNSLNDRLLFLTFCQSFR